jgi:hypothetical protein
MPLPTSTSTYASFVPFLRPLVMLSLPLVLWLWPAKVSPRFLLQFAFAIWLAGGIVLTSNGMALLQGWLMTNPGADWHQLIVPVILAAVVGYGKGRFVLGKTSARNIERIGQMSEPQKLIAVYSTRSWIVIAAMVGISVALTLSHIAPYWRGIINVGIGMGLMVSAQAYVQALQYSTDTTTSNTATTDR